ncbi:MAG TPA: amino acid permease, partial [Bacteroidota bacterium]
MAEHDADTASSHPQLLRVLGLREGISIHMGAIIGSGIFLVPATIAGHLHAMGPIMLVWVVAGMLTLFGALTLAELSAVLPQAGGPYIYLSHSYGRIWGFLFSWNDFFINKAGSAAAIAFAFATYLGYFIPAINPKINFFTFESSFLGPAFGFGIGWVQVIAVATILFVTVVNVRGVKFGGWVTTIFTAAKVVALLGLIIAVFVSGKGSAHNFLPWWPDQWSSIPYSAFGLAMISALWAYDGWIDVTLTAGEFKNPERNVPWSLIIGSVAVITLYLLANIAYAYVIPLDVMSHSSRIAGDVAQTVLGPVGASFIIVGIMCSTFGTTNGMLLAGPRSLYAAAVGGTMTRKLADVHPKYRTPYVA